MKQIQLAAVLSAAFASGLLAGANASFTGRIEATLTRAGQVQTFITTAGTNYLRIERGETNRPYSCNLIDRTSGEITLLFPHNRSYVVLKKHEFDIQAQSPAMPPMSTPLPPAVGPTNLPGMSEMPAPPAIPERPVMPQMPAMPAMGGGMPIMSMMPMEPIEVAATGEETNLLGFACQRYVVKQRGEVMEIWAASNNLPFAPWMRSQPTRFGPRRIEEQWGKLIADKQLFPLLAVLKFENSPERLRYEVKSVKLQKPEDQSAELFLPPADYQQTEPLPF